MPQATAKATFCSTLRESLPEFDEWRAAELESFRVARERAEQERLAREQAERERKDRIRKFEEDRARLVRV